MLLARVGTAGVVYALAVVGMAADQAPEPRFTPLFDGKTLEGWVVENGDPSSFVVRDGVLRVEGRAGWLRSAREFRDFALRTEFRFLTPDADSGIFVRAVGRGTFMRGWPGDSYQVQVRVPTAPGPLPPVGGLFRHGTPPGDLSLDAEAVRKAFTGVGEWQRLELEAAGESLIVRLNGAETTRATGLAPRAGFLGIQAEAGIVEYRTLEIREMSLKAQP